MTRIRTRSGRPHVVILDENLPVPLDRRVWQEGRALVDAGYRVTIIAPRGAGDMRRPRRAPRRDPDPALPATGGDRDRRLPRRIRCPRCAFSAAWLLALRLRGRIDVIHGCNPPDLFFLLGRLGRAFGARYVFDQHDANPELADHQMGSPADRPAAGPADRCPRAGVVSDGGCRDRRPERLVRAPRRGPRRRPARPDRRRPQRAAGRPLPRAGGRDPAARRRQACGSATSA